MNWLIGFGAIGFTIGFVNAVIISRIATFNKSVVRFMNETNSWKEMHSERVQNIHVRVAKIENRISAAARFNKSDN